MNSVGHSSGTYQNYNSLRYFGPFLWSKLSNKDRNLPSLNSFKRNIRTRDLSSLVDNNCSGCGLCSS